MIQGTSKYARKKNKQKDFFSFFKMILFAHDAIKNGLKP
jgi:hypothetical protein